MKKKSLILLAVLPLLGIFWFWSSPEAEDNKLLVDRLWIDHVPHSEREKISILIALSEEEVGIFQHTSVYQGDYDLFQFKQEGNRLQIHMLQSNKKTTATYKATRCSERGFDYCLEISGSPRGPKRYYSREGWEIGSMEEAFTSIQKLAAE